MSTNLHPVYRYVCAICLHPGCGADVCDAQAYFRTNRLTIEDGVLYRTIQYILMSEIPRGDIQSASEGRYLVTFAEVSALPECTGNTVPLIDDLAFSSQFELFVLRFGPLAHAIPKAYASFFDHHGVMYPWFHGNLACREPCEPGSLRTHFPAADTRTTAL